MNFWTLCPEAERKAIVSGKAYEIFTLQAVSSIIAEHTHIIKNEENKNEFYVFRKKPI